MDPSKSRKAPRYKADLTLHSSSLPSLQGHIVDLSEAGARVELRGAAPPTLLHQVIRFGASLPGQQTAYFQGRARVAWLRDTDHGWEAGLEWQGLPSQEKIMLGTVLELLEP